MELFSRENIHISQIYTVNLYKLEANYPPKSVKYNINLHCYEMIFFISGECTTCFGTELIQDRPNSIRYLPKGIKTGEYTVTEIVSPTCCIDIYFDTSDPMPTIASGYASMSRLRNLFEKIYNIWSSKKPGYYTKAMSVFYDIIHTFQIQHDNYLGKAQKEKLAPAYDYLLDNYKNTKFDYREMCRKSGLSYSYFKELFIRQYGISPIKYVTHLKLELAKELLITQKYSITEIAEICGFENVYYFSTVFKKETGVSPNNFKIHDNKI